MLFTPRFQPLRALKPLIVATGSVITGYAYYQQQNFIHSEDKSTVQVHPSVDPFPRFINSPLSTVNELVGYGIREVSFLKFQVYALGLYVAKEDTPLIKQILDSKFLESIYETDLRATHEENLKCALGNPEISNVLARNLITSGVKFSARICAVRNTDLSHLRDGFIRTIMNNPTYKEMMNSDDESLGERITNGLDELRNCFNANKMNAKKNSLLFMEMTKSQGIKITVQVAKGDSRADPIVIGEVKEPLIAELLFESYLGAKKPLIRSVQETSVNYILELF
ncbi:Aim46 protein [Martiniozyma asiatica (nom. inval.)]|nr:Aim46 protein [Martiniozyma asiatica]